ncbi:MAG: hypothetical protein ABI597_05830 [Gammaproteobacteria bacterium]
MTAIRYSKSDAIIIFFCAIIFFTLGLKHQEVVSFQARFYLFALEMWNHGPSLFPTTYRMPYPDYPATSTFLIYLAAKLFGGLNKLTAILPSAIAAALTLVATYQIGNLQTRRIGWCAVGFLIFTLAFLMEARTVSLDMFVAAVSTWCFYAIYSAKLQQKSMPRVLLISLLVFSFAIRGPIGLVIPASIICVFYLMHQDYKEFLLFGLLSFILLLCCTGVLLAVAYHAGGTHFLHEVLRMEVMGRLQNNDSPPSYFYFVESIGAYAITYPFAILMLLGLLPKLFTRSAAREIKFLQILIAWVLIIMLGMSIPGDKKVRYVLSAAPALALICSYLLMTAHQSRYLIGLKRLFYLLCAIIPSLCLGLLAILYRHQIELHYIGLAVCFFVIQLIVVILRDKNTAFFLAAFSFLLANIFMIEPIDLTANKTRAFVRQVENLRKMAQAKLFFYHEGKDGAVIKYLIDMPEEEAPSFLADINGAPTTAFIIASAENFRKLSKVHTKNLRIIAQGKIGHDSFIVFSKSAAHREAGF